MLILTRRENERLMIGDDIVITVLKSDRGQVKLGVDAPRDVQVHREEIYNRMNTQQDQRRSE